MEEKLTCCSNICRHNSFSVTFVISVKELQARENHNDRKFWLFHCPFLSCLSNLWKSCSSHFCCCHLGLLGLLSLLFFVFCVVGSSFFLSSSLFFCEVQNGTHCHSPSSPPPFGTPLCRVFIFHFCFVGFSGFVYF